MHPTFFKFFIIAISVYSARPINPAIVDLTKYSFVADTQSGPAYYSSADLEKPLVQEVNLALSAEKRLIKQLMDNYTNDGMFGRPIKVMNRTLRVGYGISLIQIMGVDAKDQVLSTNVWCKYKWRDESLQWNPLHHGNITIVRVPINSIWKPDFVLYNYADERLTEQRHTMALIDPYGTVTYIPPVIFKSSCAIDTTNFPFDEQLCHMKFGSWTYNGNALDPYFIDNKEFIDLSEYMPSQEWIILEHNAKKNVHLYDCCPNEPYPDLTFYLKLRRRATFYSYTLILPCVLLSFITMVLFMLPPETPAKMLLGINIYIAFFMLLLLLRESTPPTAKQIPILGAYYCFNMTMTTVSTFFCAILVDMHYRADKRNPPARWLTYIVIEVIAKAMFLHIPPSIQAVLELQRIEADREKRRRERIRRLSMPHPRLEQLKRRPTIVRMRKGIISLPEQLCECVVVPAPRHADDTAFDMCLMGGSMTSFDVEEIRAQEELIKEHNTLVRTTSNKHNYQNFSHLPPPLIKFDAASPCDLFEINQDLENLKHNRHGSASRAPNITVRLNSDSSDGSSSELCSESCLGDGSHMGSISNLKLCEHESSDEGKNVQVKAFNARKAMSKSWSYRNSGIVHPLPLSSSPPVPSRSNRVFPNERTSLLNKSKAESLNRTQTGTFVGATRTLGQSAESSISRKYSSKTRHRMLPSKSFDLKHYNKFNMSSTPTDSLDSASLRLDPVLRRLEEQVERLSQTASVLARTPVSPRQSVGIKLDAPQKHTPLGRLASTKSILSAKSLSSLKARKSLPVAKKLSKEDRHVAEVLAQPATIASEIHLIRNMLARFLAKMAQKETNKRNAEAWRFISMVLDRVFLFGYIISMIISLTAIFPQRPPELSDTPRYPNGTLKFD